MIYFQYDFFKAIVQLMYIFLQVNLFIFFKHKKFNKIVNFLDNKARFLLVFFNNILKEKFQGKKNIKCNSK